jgi:hypothetical protein
MKTALRFLAVVAVFLAPSFSAAQSPIGTESSVDPLGIRSSDGEITADVQRYISRGDELIGRTRFDAAAQQYLRAADLAHRDGHLPSLTRWKAASAYYFGDNFVKGAAALDQLSTEAAAVGDLEVEALAIYYSAWLNGKAGRKVEATSRLAQLAELLRSRYMPVAVRDHLSDLLKTSKEVAVEN